MPRFGSAWCLAAWELMVPSWLTDHNMSTWNDPSIDFVFADERGAINAFELKRAVRGPGDAWRVLAQVTHRAVMISESRNLREAASGVRPESYT